MSSRTQADILAIYYAFWKETDGQYKVTEHAIQNWKGGYGDVHQLYPNYSPYYFTLGAMSLRERTKAVFESLTGLKIEEHEG